MDGDTVEHVEGCQDGHREGTQTDVRTLRVLAAREIAAREAARPPRFGWR